MNNPRVSIIIPAWNEQQRLPKYLDQWLKLLAENFDAFEIIIVDDGSTDGLADEMADHPEYGKILQVLRRRHEGKGAAVKAGMLEAKGDIMLFCDADGATPARELVRLLRVHTESGVPIVIASRVADDGETSIEMSFPRRVISRTFAKLASFITGLRFYDTQCGFKLFTRQAARMIFSRITSRGWAFDIEVLLWAKKLGLRAIEVPVSWSGKHDSRIRPVRDGLLMLADIIRIRHRVAGAPPQKGAAEYIEL